MAFRAPGLATERAGHRFRGLSFPRLVALAGGVGAARFLRGLVSHIPADRLTVIVNTADDDEFWGLSVSPDIDTIIYNLAGLAPAHRGWGLRGDTGRVRRELSRLGASSWFEIGDLDMATHLARTEALRRGEPLHRVTAQLARARGIESTVLPMSNEPVRTIIETTAGHRLSFQEYFVARRARDRVRAVRHRGLSKARPAPGVLSAIQRASTLVFPPSNPFTSLLPILGLRGVRNALRARTAPLVGVSPVAGGRAVRGPLAGMLRAYGQPVSPVGVSRLYAGLLDGMLIDPADAWLASRLEREGIAVRVTDIRMPTPARSRAVAREVLALAEEVGHERRS